MCVCVCVADCVRVADCEGLMINDNGVMMRGL